LQVQEPAPQPTATPTAAPSSTLVARVTRDPVLRQHLEAIKAQLAPDDAQLAVHAVMQMPLEEQDGFIEQLKAASVEEAAEVCRGIAADLKNSMQQVQPPPEGAAA
jgi:hypothetical protein